MPDDQRDYPRSNPPRDTTSGSNTPKTESWTCNGKSIIVSTSRNGPSETEAAWQARHDKAVADKELDCPRD